VPRVVVKVSGREQGSLLPGTALSPLHPGSRDPELARWYVTDVASAGAAEELARALVSLPGVEAAFVKPGDEPAG
jgi:hypothetical protein